MRPRVTSVGLIMPPDPARHHAYPDHIERSSLDVLPCTHGVYFFLGRNDVPLYIGKSVNIRSRVLSHLRTPEEAAMLQNTCRIDYLQTAGEIGALLLESQLIKKLQPAYNTLLKFSGEAFVIALEIGERRPQILGSSEAAYHEARHSYGLFASRGAALEGLRLLVRQHGLCPALLGLEQATHGRACFSRQIGRCLGACIGAESGEAHHARLRGALERLQASVWPYDGAVGIVEECEGRRQIHVVDRWAYLGSLEGRRKKIKRPAKQFIDMDTYKILARPMLNGELKLVAI